MQVKTNREAGQTEQQNVGRVVPQLEHRGEIAPCWKVLDRYRWTDGLAFVSHGARIGVRANDPMLLSCLRDYLPPGWAAAPSPVVDSLFSVAVVESRSRTNKEPHFFLYQGSCRVGHTRKADEVLQILESGLHGQVAAQAREHLFVHAGAVAWNGEAIVIPGRSFSGKSSLVAALVRAGATYLSDEYAVVDVAGYVHPYAKRLSLRGEDGRPRGRYCVEALGGQVATEPMPVGLVLAAQYEAGARWRPRPLSPARAMLALLDNTVQVRSQPEAALGTLHTVAMAAEAFKGKRGEADQVASWLRGRLQKR